MTIITIIGVAGKMGKWFFEYFNSMKNNPYKPENVSICPSIKFSFMT